MNADYDFQTKYMKCFYLISYYIQLQPKKKMLYESDYDLFMDLSEITFEFNLKLFIVFCSMLDLTWNVKLKIYY